MSPSLSAIRGFPARGRISARIRRPRPAPSPPITPSSGRGGRRDEQGPVPLLRPAGPHVRRDPADLQPGGTEDHRRWSFPLQRRDVVFSDHVYLRRCLQRSLWIWRFAAPVLAAMGIITVWLPPAPGWDGQAAFARVFNFVPRIIASSLAAFWCGEFANSFVMAKMKLLTKGRYLWTRTVGSTVAGQAVDTFVVTVLTFGGSLSAGLIANLILSGYLAKVLYEVAATPVTYWIVNSLKRREGVDVFDTNTDFNPFHGEG